MRPKRRSEHQWERTVSRVIACLNRSLYLGYGGQLIGLPAEVVIEGRDAGISPGGFAIRANTDTEFTLVNQTLETKTLFIEEAAVTQEVPASETVTIIVNAPVGEYVFGLVEDETLTGTLHVIEGRE